MTVYYEASGTIKKELVKCVDKLARNGKAMNKWAKSVGAKKAIFSDSFGQRSVTGAVFKDPPDPKLWKEMKGSGIAMSYSPRRSLAAGRKIAANMEKLSTSIRKDIDNIVRLNEFNGFTFHTAGVSILGTKERPRVIVKIGDNAKFKGNRTPNGLRRISDMSVDRLEKKRAK